MLDAGTVWPVGIWKVLVDFLVVWIKAVSVAGAQLDDAPVSEMPDGMVPLRTPCWIGFSCSSIWQVNGDQ